MTSTIYGRKAAAYEKWFWITLVALTAPIWLSVMPLMLIGAVLSTALGAAFKRFRSRS